KPRLANLRQARDRFVYMTGYLRSMAREPDPGIRDELGLAQSAMHEIEGECARRGIAFGVARFPGILQCEPSTLNDLLVQLGLDPKAFDRREPGASMVADARGRGVPVRDLLPILEVQEGERSPCYFREGHPNRAGNERFAQEILNLLEGDE